ncbi:hypothetical protein D3C72_1986950 [compost metagenome]
MNKFIVAALAFTMTASVALAGRHGGGRGHGGGHHRGGHGGGGPSASADYGDGVLAGLLLSTAALFTSHITAEQNQAVYLYADNDAAEFIANDGQEKPTMALAQAMNYERNFLAQAQVAGASDLNDVQVAYLVMKRAESL